MAEERRRSRTATRRRRTRTRRKKVKLTDRAIAVAESAWEHPGALFAVAIALMVALMMYGPVRNYYVAMRSGQDLQARYDALVEQNDAIREDLGRLQSQEGIEDEAHRRGYVKDGETGVITEGLPEEDLNELLGDIELEDTRPWYIRVLDLVFFYSQDNWQ